MTVSPSRRSIVLIGHRGCGKSTVARLLAQRLGRPLIDIDERIESTCGRTIAELFAQDEACFRAEEARAIAALQPEPAAIISVGAGAVEASDNREQLRRRGNIVWLQADEPERHRRLAGDPTSPTQRPPLAASAAAADHRQTRRDVLYADLADWTLDTTGLSPTAVCAAICAQFAAKGGD